MDHTKIYQADLDFPRRELSVRGLGFVVALSVRSGINFRVRLLGEQSSSTYLFQFYCILPVFL